MAKLLDDYTPPDWARQLTNIPTVKIRLANSNTPIQPWDLPGIPDGVSVSIKRDDMTGSAVTGTKIRKLEFLMADALTHNCKHIITVGRVQSNHCRAVAISARRLGLVPHLIVLRDEQKSEMPDCSGNLLLHHICGSVMYLEPTNNRNFDELDIKMEKLAAYIKETNGQKSYQIPLGGTSQLGLFGDITLFSELIEQGVLDNYDDLICACGSGGTAAGLAIANFLTGSKLRVHGISISKDAIHLHSKINKLINSCGLAVKSEDILNIIDCHTGGGYALYTEAGLAGMALTLSKTFLRKCKRKSEFLSRIITTDETWVHYYEPESQQQSMVWKHNESPPPKKAKTVRSMGKVMCVVFMNCRGVILVHMVPAGQTVNASYYSKVGRSPKNCDLYFIPRDKLNDLVRYILEKDFIKTVGISTGIILDPVYTGKAVKGLVHELNHNTDMFQGNRILYLHTGGIFGIYDENIYSYLTQSRGSQIEQTTANRD